MLEKGNNFGGLITDAVVERVRKFTSIILEVDSRTAEERCKEYSTRYTAQPNLEKNLKIWEQTAAAYLHVTQLHPTCNKKEVYGMLLRLTMGMIDKNVNEEDDPISREVKSTFTKTIYPAMQL